MRLIPALLLISIFYSCSENVKKSDLQPISKIEIPIEGLFFNFKYKTVIDKYSRNDTLFLVFMDGNGRYLSFNTELLKIENIYNLKQVFIEFGTISSLSHFNADSVLVLCRDNNWVGIWNRKTMTTRTIATFPDFVFQIMDSSYEGLKSLGFQSFPIELPRYVHGKYYIPKELGFPLDPKSVINPYKSQKPTIKEKLEQKKLEDEYEKMTSDFSFLKKEASYFEIDEKKKKENSTWISPIIGMIPESYTGEKAPRPFLQYRSNLIDENQNLILSYWCAHELFILDSLGGVSKTKTVKSKYIDSFKPIAFNVADSENKRRSSTEPAYVGLHYDSYRNLYYRIVLHRQEYLQAGQIKVNKQEDRTFSVIVFDSNFNVLRERFFEANKYQATISFITKEGLFLQSLETTDNTLIFEGFEL